MERTVNERYAEFFQSIDDVEPIALADRIEGRTDQHRLDLIRDHRPVSFHLPGATDRLDRHLARADFEFLEHLHRQSVGEITGAGDRDGFAFEIGGRSNLAPAQNHPGQPNQLGADNFASMPVTMPGNVADAAQDKNWISSALSAASDTPLPRKAMCSTRRPYLSKMPLSMAVPRWINAPVNEQVPRRT